MFMFYCAETALPGVPPGGSLRLSSNLRSIEALEAALRQVELERHALLDGLKDILVQYFDRNRQVVWSNAADLGLVADSRAGRDGRHCFKLHGVDFACPDCPIDHAWRTGETTETEIELADGRVYQVRVSPISDANGDTLLVLLIGFDVTDARRAQEGYRLLVDNAGDLFAKADADNRIVFVSPSLERELAERRRAEQEKERIQAQLLQSQKMEAVGPAGRRHRPRLQQPADRHRRLRATARSKACRRAARAALEDDLRGPRGRRPRDAADPAAAGVPPPADPAAAGDRPQRAGARPATGCCAA